MTATSTLRRIFIRSLCKYMLGVYTVYVCYVLYKYSCVCKCTVYMVVHRIYGWKFPKILAFSLTIVGTLQLSQNNVQNALDYTLNTPLWSLSKYTYIHICIYKYIYIWWVGCFVRWAYISRSHLNAGKIYIFFYIYYIYFCYTPFAYICKGASDETIYVGIYIYIYAFTCGGCGGWIKSKNIPKMY